MQSSIQDGHDLSQTSVDRVTIESMYESYFTNTLFVNRRYQRKLVWTLEQKEQLIDSIVKGLPLPLILLANTGKSAPGRESVEIIDGLQRLNAIFAFIENEFPWNGKYFNLKAFAVANDRNDDPDDNLKQQQPTLDRKTSVDIAKYVLPITSYSAANPSQVDEVFRRINSSGRQLSRQEVRQAGITSQFAGLVRKLSTEMRGDSTKSEILPMSAMGTVSIAFGDMSPRGLSAEDIFWVKHNVLIRDDLRSSLDEQLVLDILLDLLDLQENLSNTTRNKAFDPDSDFAQKIDSLLRREGDNLSRRFQDVMTIIQTVCTKLETENQSLMRFMGRTNNNSVTRYFLVFFLAIDRLLETGERLADLDKLVSLIENYWRGNSLPSGSTWPYGNVKSTNSKSSQPGRQEQITKMRQRIRDAFEPAEASGSLTGLNMKASFLKDMRNYATETDLFELKSGLLDLSPAAEPKIQKPVIKKILKTASAMANSGPNVEGSIYIGVADTLHTADKVNKKFGATPMLIEGSKDLGDFQVIGLNHELDTVSMDLDQYITQFVSTLRDAREVNDTEFKDTLIKGISWLRLEGNEPGPRFVLSIRVRPLDHPIEFEKTFFKRSGSECIEVKGAEVLSLHRRFE